MGKRARHICLVTLAALLLVPAGAQAYDDWNSELPGFPSNTPDSPRSDCLNGSGECVDRTIGEMWRRFHTVVPTCDDNNIFSLTYIRVTQDIRTAVAEGFYPDLQWINQQDAMFARIYFLAYDNYLAGRRDLVPESWLTTFDAGRDGSVQGIGNLLLSMNAHINRDFPFILYQAGLTNPDGSSKKPDHDAYNTRLRALYKPVIDEIAARFDPSVDDYDVPGVTADDDAFFQLLIQWRETAWQNASRLAAAETDAERRTVAADIETYANGWAAMIKAGSTYLPGQTTAERDAVCAAHGGQRSDYSRGADVARSVGGVVLGGKRLRVKLRCPSGPGPCKGMLKVRRPRLVSAGHKQLMSLARKRFSLEAGDKARVSLRLGHRQRAQLAKAGGRRGVWIAARSKQGPGDAVTKRRKAKIRIR